MATLEDAIGPGLARITELVIKATSGDLDGGGKLLPQQGMGSSGINPAPAKKCDCAKSGDGACKCADVEEAEKSIEVAIIKASSDEKQIVVGLVLAPEATDAQGDVYDADVIEAAAHNFLAGYNKTTKLGFQHKDFKNWHSRFELVESWIAPMDLSIGDVSIKAGTWIMSVRVLDAAVWKMVKAGKIKGFSIGGKAKVKKLKQEALPMGGQTGGQKL